MSEMGCCKKGEAEDSREAKRKTTRLPCPVAEPNVHPEKAAGPKQLMCSLNRAEVEGVKEELSRAGIETETRNSAAAEALGVTGYELWVKREREFTDASNIYTTMQGRSRGAATTASPAAEAGKARSTADPIRDGTDSSQNSGAKEPHSAQGSPAPEPIEQDLAVLQKCIDEMLEFQRDVVAQCVSVRGKTSQLRQVFAEKQAALCNENQERAVAQRRQAEAVTNLQADLQRERSNREDIARQLEEERAKRQESEEQLSKEKQSWHQEGRTQEESLAKAQDKLDLQARLLQTHAAAVLKLKKELAALEEQRLEDRKLVARLREELAAERKTRLAAEREAEAATAESSRSLPSLLFRRLATKKAPSN